MNTALHIVADIGGTNARFAHLQADSHDLRGLQVFPCADFPFLVDAIRTYIEGMSLQAIDQICLAVAGPVENDLIDLPNNHWAFSRSELQQALGVSVTIINDFSAQVLSVSSLSDAELQWIGDARPSAVGTTAVLGPGTGLGVAAMLQSGDILPSEGGHVAFAPTTDHEVRLLKELQGRYSRVSVERVLSGGGLSNLYWANSRLQGSERELPAAEVSAGARARDPLSIQALNDFCAILGSVAGDVALMMGATGGVYLSGGILPKITDLVDTALIRERFDYKGRLSGICANIPLAIVLAEYPGLVGCVEALRRLPGSEDH
jgi:glucokinase